MVEGEKQAKRKQCSNSNKERMKKVGSEASKVKSLEVTDLSASSSSGTVLGSLRYLYEREGLVSLWRGSVTSGLLFFARETSVLCFRDYFDSRVGSHTSLLARFGYYSLSGGAAALSTQVLFYPWELAATLRTRTPSSLVEVFRATLARGGVCALYSGFASSVLKTVLMRVVQFGLLSTWRVEHELRKGGEHDMGDVTLRRLGAISDAAIASLLCAVIANMVVHPFGNIKVHTMNAVNTAGEFRCFGAAVADLYSRRGLRGFFSGWRRTLLYSASQALLLVSYEVLSSTSSTRKRIQRESR